MEKEYRDIEYQYEIKFQQYNFLDEENKRLLNNYNNKICDIYQKAGLKNLILEKELKLISVNIGEKNLVIQEILQKTDLAEEEKMALKEQIDNFYAQKEEKIEDLKKRITDIRIAHLQMVNTFNKNLKENHIPLDELGFQPKLPKVQINRIVFRETNN